MGEEVINVVTIQKGLEDLTDIRSLDREPLLNHIAKDTDLNLDSLLGFVDLFAIYKYKPNKTNALDILVNFVIDDVKPDYKDQDKEKLKLKTNLNITESGNNAWSYYLPKELSPDALRILLPRRTKIGKFIFPKDLFIDITEINGTKSSDTNGIVTVYTTAAFAPAVLPEVQGPQKYSELTIVHPLYKDNTVPKRYKSALAEIKDYMFYPVDWDNIAKHYKFNLNQNIMGYLISSSAIKPVIELINDRDTLLHLKRFENKLKERKFRSELNKKVIKTKTENVMICNLINTYYPDKYCDIKKHDNVKSILSKLPKKEQDYIMSVYKTKLNFIEGQNNNKCPHLQVYANLRLAKRPAKVKQYLKELKSYIAYNDELDKGEVINKVIDGKSGSGTATAHNYLTCRLCKRNLICPHLLEYLTLESNRAEYRVIKERMDTYTDLSQGLTFQNFCKICGEELLPFNEEEIETDKHNIVFDVIYKKIWSYSMILYNSVKTIPIISVYDFSSVISSTTLPMLINSTLRGVKTELNIYLTNGTITAILDIYIWLYLYAYTLHIIRESITNPVPTHIKIRLAEDEGVNLKLISDYAKLIMARFEKQHRGLSAEARTFDIAGAFKDIFMEISNQNVSFFIERTFARKEMILAFLSNNSYFKYTFEEALSAKKIELKDNMTIEQSEQLIEKLIDKPMVKAVKLSLVEILLGLIEIKGDKIYNIFRKWFLQYTDKGPKGEIKSNEEFFAPLVEDNKKLKNVYFYECVAFFSILNAQKVYKLRTYTTDPTITAIYSIDGSKYVWDEPVYEDIKTFKGIDTKHGGFARKVKKEVVNYRSKKHNLLMTDTSKFDKKEVIKNHNRLILIIVFFERYEVICPKGGIHTYDPTSSVPICTKCGYNKKEMQAKNIEGIPKPGGLVDNYYNKFTADFEKDMKKLDKDRVSLLKENINVDITGNKKPTGSECLNRQIKDREDIFKSDTTIEAINEVSGFINVPVIVLLQLGRMSNRFPDEIVNRKLMDVKYTDNPHHRSIHMIQGYLLYVLSLYNMYKYKKLDNITLNKMNLGMLPDIPSKYGTFLMDVHNKFIYTYTARSIYLSYLKTICEFILFVKGLGGERNELFAKYLIESIIKQSYDLCKPKNPNMALLRNKKNVTEPSEVYDHTFEEEYEKEDLQMFVNDFDYTGYNDSVF